MVENSVNTPVDLFTVSTNNEINQFTSFKNSLKFDGTAVDSLLPDVVILATNDVTSL